MQNDVLKNEIAPWQEKGRWYHGVWDIVNKAWIPDKTDAFLLDNNNVAYSETAGVAYMYLLDKTKQFYDIKYITIDDVVPGSATNLPIGTRRMTPGGYTGIAFSLYSSGSPAITDGLCELYFFIG